MTAASGPETVRRHHLFRLVRSSDLLMRSLRGLRQLDLPDAWLVSGAIYQTVWNALTGRPPRTGLKDIDLFYFDPDTSWEAEDRQIRRAAALFPADPPVELRNQARVHLWAEARFGRPLPRPYRTSRDAIGHFAARTHCVALRLSAAGRLRLHAPFGLEAIFALRLEPNPRLDNRATYEAKALRQREVWPELTVLPWEDRTC